jgi:hypothetical protein
MSLTITYAELKALDPCENALRRVAKLMGGAKQWTSGIDAATARKAGATFDDIVWVASVRAHTNSDIERRLRLWLADCAAHVHHIYAADYPNDDRPRKAIEASRRFARGEIDDAARAAAWAAAWAAASVARAAAWAAAWAAARAAARAAAWAAAWAAARAAAWAAEEQWQFDRLILWLSEAEPKDWPITKPKAKAA